MAPWTSHGAAGESLSRETGALENVASVERLNKLGSFTENTWMEVVTIFK